MKKVVEDSAIDLSKINWHNTDKPMFNVTVLTDKNNQKLARHLGKTLHVIEIDYEPESIIGFEGVKPENVKSHEKRIIKDFVYKEDNKVSKLISNSNFDVSY